MMPLKFKNPPLDEVVISIYFSPIKGFQTQHAGLYWSKERKNYPTCESIDTIGDWVQFDDEPVPVPRYRLSSADNVRVIQIQRNAFTVNWRSIDPNVEYPHYEDLRNYFIQAFTNFKEFIARELNEKIAEIDSMNLGYMNFIATGENNTFASVKNYIPSVRGIQIPEEIGQVEGFGQSFGVVASEDLSARLSVNSAVRGYDSASGARFELRAIGIPENADNDAILGWLDRGHSLLETLFSTYTSSYAHQQWGLISDHSSDA